MNFEFSHSFLLQISSFRRLKSRQLKKKFCRSLSLPCFSFSYPGKLLKNFSQTDSNTLRIEDIEKNERKNNLIIKGIPQDRRLERPSHLQGMVKKLFKQSLKLSGVHCEEVRMIYLFWGHNVLEIKNQKKSLDY